MQVPDSNVEKSSGMWKEVKRVRVCVCGGGTLEKIRVMLFGKNGSCKMKGSLYISILKPAFFAYS